MFRNLIAVKQHLIKQSSWRNLQIFHKPTTYTSFTILNQRYFSHEISKGWPDDIKVVLERNNITEPTPIQEQAVPLIMDGKNLVGIARTGSGKTLAFALPVIVKILNEKNKLSNETRNESDTSNVLNNRGSSRQPYCVVLAPTRELATQITSVFDLFHKSVSTICLVGGRSKEMQQRMLSKMNFEVYVATPGRLNDLISTNDISLSNVKYFIIDEADRLLDMGFEPQLRQISNSIRTKGRQTLMFTATWPEEVKDIAAQFLNNFQLLQIDSPDLKANPNIKQITEVCSGMDKPKHLIKYIKSVKDEDIQSKFLIFCNQKRTVDHVRSMLARHSYKVTGIHGDRSQAQRDNAIETFSTNIVDMLVATDVAARGLDIKNVTHVINYDLPLNMEDYVHRIGRTARHNKTGTSYTLVTENDANVLKKFLKQLRESGSDIPESLLRLHEDTKFYNPVIENKRMMGRSDYLPYGKNRNYKRSQNRYEQNRYEHNRYEHNRHEQNY